MDTLKQEIKDKLANCTDENTLQLINSILTDESKTKEIASLEEKISVLAEERDKIYSIISFELGSPINSLVMLSEMLKMDIERLDKAGIVGFLGHLDAQIVKISQMTKNLIEWASHEVKNYKINARTFNLHKLIEKQIAPHADHAGKKGITISNLVPEETLAFADERMIGIVIENLISNAIKFSPKDREVILSATRTEDNLLEFSITDHGIGMGMGKISKLFNPERKAMQKGTANESGFGLGMIVIKALLLLNNTDLNIESKQGKGTTFSFVLPINNPENA